MLIDANVFKGYFQMQLGKGHSLCGCPITLFQSVTALTPVYHDTGKIIEHEWGNVVDRDWFEAWLATSLVSGVIQYLDPIYNRSIENKLRGLGFPGGRDRVYVQVGLSIVAAHNTCQFFTEDLDFYDPKMKGCSTTKRLDILKKSGGPIPKVLAKSGMHIRCVP